MRFLRRLAKPTANKATAPIHRGRGQRFNDDVGGFDAVEVDPRETDPAIDNWLDAHVVAYDPAVLSKKKLLVFFCGSYGIPSRQRSIIHLAARSGYHAVNLSYPNSWTVGRICRSSLDVDCHQKVRLDIIDGLGRSDHVRITPENAILNRLRRLLEFLHNRYPNDLWGRYISEHCVNWASIVAAGHSQGGGQAAVLAKNHQVDRVVMLASPADFHRGSNSPAGWLESPSATPTDRYFGFTHELDNGFQHIMSAWDMLGLAKSGAPIDVDEIEPPYNHSRRLITRYAQVLRGKYHASIVQDTATPKSRKGVPIFEPVWRYLLGA